MAGCCSCRPKAVQIDPIFKITKYLKDEGLEQIKFSKDEEKYIFKQLGFRLSHMAAIRWAIPVVVWDIDTGIRHQLELKKKGVEGTFGFFDYWHERVVLQRRFEGKELIGFYVDSQSKDFYFSELKTYNLSSSN